MGSAPRESGCRMIVTFDHVHGSIGGGNLEFTAIARARELLRGPVPATQFLQPFGLGPELNQCCGGAVHLLFQYLPAGAAPWLDELVAARAADEPAVLATEVGRDTPWHVVIRAKQTDLPGCTDSLREAVCGLLAAKQGPAGSNESGPHAEIDNDDGHWWLERIEDSRAHLWLFGAGHVGQEVAQRIRGLPFRLTWLDQRPGIFPSDATQFAELVADEPVAAVAASGAGCIFVVMSHSHQLDEDICHAILQRADEDSGDGWDFAWLGLIGSATKRKRFVHRLRQRGISESQLRRLACPIGLAGIRGKQPATIALSLLAQLMSGPVTKGPIKEG